MTTSEIEVGGLVQIGRKIFSVAAILGEGRIRLDTGAIVRVAGVEVIGSAAVGSLYREAMRLKQEVTIARLMRQLV